MDAPEPRDPGLVDLLSSDQPPGDPPAADAHAPGTTRDVANPTPIPSVMVGSVVILAALGIGAAFYVMRPVMVPLILAILVSYLVSPLVDFLQVKTRVPRPLGIVVAMIAVGLLLTGLVLLISSSIGDLAARGNQYEERVMLLVNSTTAMLQEWGLPVQAPAIRDWAASLPIANMLLSVLNQTLSSLTTLLLILISVVFLVSGRTPNAHKTGIWKNIDERVKRYIIVKVMTSAVTGILVGGILMILGVDLAVVFGLLAFILNFIPSIGSVVSTLLPLPVALFQFDTTWTVILVVALPGLVQFTIGNILEPRIMGTALSLHPITILLSLIFWGILWGIPGMLLAAPITAVLKIVLDHIPATRAVGGILEGRLPEVNAE
jgi:AI-2 transport protein TqsA